MLSEQQGQVLVRIARREIEKYLEITPIAGVEEEKSSLSGELMEKRGVFVTLHKHEALRGCIGSLTAMESVVTGVRRHALNAAFEDTRFNPVSKEEVNQLDIEVSVLTEPCDLEYSGPEDLVNKLTPFEDGVIIRAAGGNGATFLPQVWHQLPAPEDFLGRLCIKAGLPPTYWKTGKLEVQVYRVQLFKENR